MYEISTLPSLQYKIAPFLRVPQLFNFFLFLVFFGAPQIFLLSIVVFLEFKKAKKYFLGSGADAGWPVSEVVRLRWTNLAPWDRYRLQCLVKLQGR